MVEMVNGSCNEGIHDHAGFPNTFQGFNDLLPNMNGNGIQMYFTVI